ncbi:tetratricopeptide repeat domain protein [Nannochloropsis gaditana CCMP526]|uniref:tetratricopeptide repeat domain protein n=1 Tax=Nannochloropsis gaditana (strain CCMP526) TaxID=1093141 RepID=UPI00029F624E|nr:tetratricopeptide repeat domain protein [Nannochloropsis gaditana CCMP526]EKU21413.1 tetratricopeptide repeat domain protein [Nannochloropsis gaditana CCMP526]|eukprot:XP_005854950.1 tetratricopeptide repeat domain protein [Nannochloropsis gaditana CCMP526]
MKSSYQASRSTKRTKWDTLRWQYLGIFLWTFIIWQYMLWGWLYGMPEAQPKGNALVNSRGQQNSTKGYITVIEGYPRLPVEQEKFSPSDPNDVEGLTDSELDRLHIATINAFPKSTERRAISFGLYGNDSKYTIGAIRNAELAPLYFPGWIARFYVDSSVPRDVLKRLKELGAEIIMMQTTGNDLIAGMFWRFLVADDASIDRT